jgi:hypothetical protein
MLGLPSPDLAVAAPRLARRGDRDGSLSHSLRDAVELILAAAILWAVFAFLTFCIIRSGDIEMTEIDLEYTPTIHPISRTTHDTPEAEDRAAKLRLRVIREITVAPGWNKADATALVDELILSVPYARRP